MKDDECPVCEGAGTLGRNGCYACQGRGYLL